jgi:hypothetical protein
MPETSKQYEFKIRLEFDVEVADPSHIDAAFAAADWLQERARENRLSYLVYNVAQMSEHGAIGMFQIVDLEDVVSVEDLDASLVRMSRPAEIVLAAPGTVTDADRRKAAERLASMVLDLAQTGAMWAPVHEPRLQSGAQAAWPYVVRKGDKYARKTDGTIVRYSTMTVAQSVADSLNRNEGKNR